MARSKFSEIKKWLWAYSSFLLPLCFYYLGMKSNLDTSLRAGIVGLALSCLIYLLWKVSLRVYGLVLPEKYGNFFIIFSGLLLWSIWFAVAQVILIAYDEASIH